MLNKFTKRVVGRVITVLLASMAFYVLACEPEEDDDDSLTNGLILLFMANSLATPSTGWTITVPDGVPL